MKKQKLIGRSGVYAWLVNDEIKYIGSSVNMESRKSNTLARLRKGTHNIKKLQELFDKYGEESFRFVCIDYCNEESLYELERLHMLIHEDTILNHDRIVNLDKYIRTKEEKKAISNKFSKIMRGENNPNSRISENTAKMIIDLKKQGVSHKDIAKKFDLSTSYISKVGVERWKHLA